MVITACRLVSVSDAHDPAVDQMEKDRVCEDHQGQKKARNGDDVSPVSFNDLQKEKDHQSGGKNKEYRAEDSGYRDDFYFIILHDCFPHNFFDKHFRLLRLS